MAVTDRYVIDILDVTLNAIEVMASSEQEFLSPSSLARQLKINRSRLFRILKTLERRGFVDYDPQTESYRLGVKMLTLSQNLRNRLNFRREAESLLRSLVAETGDSAHLVALANDKAIVVDRYLGENTLQVAAPIGVLLPLHIGAVPKLLLAFLPTVRQERLIGEMELPEFTPYTITSKEQLCSVLAQIRRDGYAVDEQEYEIGVYAFGAPIYDNSGQVTAGISITTPASRYTTERRDQLIQRVVTTARQISARLGCHLNDDRTPNVKMEDN